jgi:hypothetical protein
MKNRKDRMKMLEVQLDPSVEYGLRRDVQICERGMVWLPLHLFRQLNNRLHFLNRKRLHVSEVFQFSIYDGGGINIGEVQWCVELNPSSVVLPNFDCVSVKGRRIRTAVEVRNVGNRYWKMCDISSIYRRVP